MKSMTVASNLATVLAVIAGLGLAGPSQAQTPLSEIVVFGDTNSSAGNVHIATGGFVAAPPYFQGHFTNGPVWVEVLAEEIGLPVPGPSLLGGTNYAWGGGESGPGFAPIGVPNLGPQIDAFLSDRGGNLTGNELLVIAGGTADLYWQAPYSPATIASNLAEHVRVLAAAGGTTFLVANIAPLGYAPEMLGGPAETRFNTLARQASRLIERRLDSLAGELGVTILRLDLAGLVEAMRQVPEAFALQNVTQRACPDCDPGMPVPGAGDTIVADPDRYLWWDGAHLTRVFHQALGQMAAEVVTAAF